MDRESRIFRSTVLLTLVLAAVALYGLGQQALADRRRAAATVTERALGIADDLREQIREAGTGADVRRQVLVAALETPPERLDSKPVGALVWEPKISIVWQRGVPGLLVEVLAGRKRWLDWSPPGRKAPPRRLLVEIPTADGASQYILWGRVDNALYALVFDQPPVNGDFSPWLWLLLTLGVTMAAVTVVAAAVALRRAAREARRNDEFKTRFISDVTHELKTPLAAMGLWTDLLRSDRLPNSERRAHALEVLSDEKNRMLRMVEQLLEFSRLEEGRRKYVLERVDMGELAAAVSELIKGDFPEGGLAVSAPEGMVACCDRDAAKGILVNLLANAAKYAADDGLVEVTVSRSAAAGGGESIRVEVADHGPGIPEEWRERLFERFRRGNDGNALAKGGFGLGLSISRQLAREMDGELAVRSRDDGGSGAVFRLELPAPSYGQPATA